jgi:hypothetical protein
VGFNRRGGDDGDQTGINNLYLTGGYNSPTAIANFTFLNDTYYDFKILDDGNSLTLYLVDLNNPILSVVTSERTGYQIGIENRGYVPWWPTYDNEAQLDYISVSTVPEPSCFALCGLAGSLFIFRSRKI